MRLRDTNQILFGGDYNPEQWPRETWEEDMRLFREAGVSVVTLNVFSWALLQPEEDVYDFSLLDEIMDIVERNDIKVVLATSTAAQPAWMARKYPKMLKVGPDGMRYRFGGRQKMCPNSGRFKRYASLLAGKLAERYADSDSLVAWHISNEYGQYCYCNRCMRKFRKWLQRHYETLDALNAAWNTRFWSHTFYSWDEIVIPDFRSEEFHFGAMDGPVKSSFQGMSLDYRRFMSESFIKDYKAERKAIRKYTPDIPITTNLMRDFEEIDYRAFAQEMDFISWDNYPQYNAGPEGSSFWHDLMRGIGGGESFCLMEQTPSVTNWHPYCVQKRPGVMRLWSYQAVAHGADTVMYFQLRRSVGACEKSHGALIDHVGTGNTRVFREMSQLGRELEDMGSALLEAKSPAEVAIVFDWENWWGVNLAAGPSILMNYLDEVREWYAGLLHAHVPVDVIGPADDLSSYKIVIAPMLYLSHASFADSVREYVRDGGRFITTSYSGYVDEHDRDYLGGYPALWRDFLGVWVEESDAMTPTQTNSFVYEGKEYPCRILCDVLHLEGAEALSTYTQDYYHDQPVVTRMPFGDGVTYYVGTFSTSAFYEELLGTLCKETGIAPLAQAPADVEVTRRVNDKGDYLFLLNHADEGRTLTAPCAMTDLLTGTHWSKGDVVTLAAKDVVIGQTQA